MSNSITLFISERRAIEAAKREQAKRQGWTLRVLSAFMREPDGSAERGFKVLMVPPRGIGNPYYI